jgi:tyrocidine synthetase-3
MGGGRLTVLEKGAEKDALVILEVIRQERITHLNFVPSMFGAFLEVLSEGRIDSLGSLKYIFLAGEALPPGLVSRFNELNTSIRLENIYGPTEATIYASGYSLGDWGGSGGIPIGKPLVNVRLYILNRWNRLVPIGVVGELCIGGAGVAVGYLNRPELTAEKFDHDLWDFQDYPDERNYEKFLRGSRDTCGAAKKNVHGGGTSRKVSYAVLALQMLPHTVGFFQKAPPGGQRQKIYRTGDLARWLPDENIEFLGRVDHQAKIRGFRIEPGEIENRLLMHEDIKEAVVVAGANKNRGRYLCAYLVGRNAGEEISIPGLREYLSKHLPGYMMPSHFVQIEMIPLTPGGKADRRALPEPEIDRPEFYTAPRGELEKRVVEIWSDILGIKKEIIGIEANFFHLGGHSLKAIELCSHLHKQLEVKMPLLEIFKNPTVQKLAVFINRAEKEQYAAVEPVEEKDYYLLSSAQKRLYFLQGLDMKTIAYNMPHILRLAEDIQIHRLEQIFRRLISRHESLRTSFHMRNEEPVQRIHGQVEFKIDVFPVDGRGIEEITTAFIRPFDLGVAPLLRVGYVNAPGNQALLVIDMHHIITDGTSQEILVKEFKALYKGEELQFLKLQYRDFSRWQNSSKQQALIKRQERYWLDCFPGEIPVLDLPGDYKRPLIQGFEGAAVGFALGPGISRGLKEVAGSSDTTFFMVIFSLFNILLARLSGQEDIIVGIPAAARRHADLEGIIGMFVNTLALRNYPRGGKTFKIFLQELKTGTLAAYENQEYPFEDLVEKVSVSRDIGRNPIFDVMFNFLDQPENKYAAGPSNVDEKEEAVYRHRDIAAKFDMNLTAVNQGETIHCELEYCTELFNAPTIERFIGYFKRIAGAVAENINVKISGIDMMDKSEKALLLDVFNQTMAAYPCEKSVCQLFEEEAARMPDSVSLVHGDIQVTFDELNRRANQLARYLIRQGLKRGSGSIAAIQGERCLELIIGIFAILKAGAAYLPIESQCPPKRRGYILNDSGTPVLLAQETFIAGPGAGRGTIDVHYINMEDPMLYRGDDTGLEGVESLSFRDLIYVIYTSGSTGIPKGVLVEHKGVINLLYFMQSLYPIDTCGAYLLKTNYVFDVSVTEIFGWVLGGGKLVILEPGMEKEPLAILEMIERYGITHINFVPSMLNMFFDCIDGSSGLKLKRLKYILTAGEAFSKILLKKSGFLPSRVRVENIYGPTEASVYTTGYSCDPGSGLDFVPIGKPLPNVRTYILDKWNRLVPRGAAGELCIGGMGVARGYLNNPELTAEKFFPVSYRSYRSYISSKRIYKTGDLVRWLPDGNIEFLGRVDHQVKIRGYRIELGEQGG